MSWTHLKDETPKAAKPHQCFLCGLPIVVGETHVRRLGLQSKALESFRMHVACEAETKGWDEGDWNGHDADEFRECVLGITSEEQSC